MYEILFAGLFPLLKMPVNKCSNDENSDHLFLVHLIPIKSTISVSYHLCIRHTLGTVFELYQSLENTHRYFHIIKTENMYRPSYAA